MSNSNLVSVIITAYNAKQYLAEAVDSVLNQSYTDLEIILVNDGSKDNTLEIMQQYEAQDSRVVVISHENMGISASNNRALKMARGHYIAKLDADDVMTPNRIEEQVKFLQENPQIGMLSSDAIIINDKGEHVGTQVMPGYQDVAYSRKIARSQGLVICAHTGFMAYKKAYEDVGGYNEGISCAVDLEIFRRMIEKGYNLVILRKFLVKYRIYRSSVVGKNTKSYLVQNTVAYIQHSIKRRANGQKPIRLEEFIEELKAEPWLKRIKRKRDYIAYQSYRSALEFISLKNYPSAFYRLSVAFALKPINTYSRLYRQVKRRFATKTNH